jgi:hypothetical protein
MLAMNRAFRLSRTETSEYMARWCRALNGQWHDRVGSSGATFVFIGGLTRRYSHLAHPRRMRRMTRFLPGQRFKRCPVRNPG